MEAYIVFIVAICLFLCVIGKVLTKKLINPVTVFCGEWAVIIMLAGLKLNGLKSASDSTFLIFLSGSVFFTIGFFLLFKSRIRLTIGRRSKYTTDFVLKYKLVYALGSICVIYFMFQFIQVIPLILSGSSLGTIRALAQNKEVVSSFSGKIINAIRVLVIMPFSYAILPVTAMDFWLGKRDKKLLLLCGLILFLRLMSEGGRISILYFALHLFVGFTYFKDKTQKSRMVELLGKIRKSKKVLYIGMIFMAVIILWASLSRTTNNFLSVLYYYFAMQPYMFEVWADVVVDRGIVGWGVGSFNGMIFPFLYLIKNILGVGFPAHFERVYRIILETDSEWQIISAFGTRANAYVGSFWYFFLDGGVVGVCLLSLIYGAIGGKLFANAKHRMSIKEICLYSFYMQSVVLSFSGFAFSSVYYGLAYVFLMFFFYKPLKATQ